MYSEEPDVKGSGMMQKDFRQPQQIVSSNCSGYNSFSISTETIKTEVEIFKRQMGIVAHELRTPLALILGYAGILQRNLNPAYTSSTSDIPVKEKSLDAVNHSLEVILEQAGQMNYLITQLYDLAAVQNKKLEVNPDKVIDLFWLLEKVVIQQGLIRSSHHITLAASEQKVKVVGDKRRIEQVLNNLISNAVKYSPDGSKVTVGFEVSNSESVTVWVQDEGFGIKQDEQEGIFEQFSRGNEQLYSGIEGLGLGLYICRLIVQQHGGKIWLESQAGLGSTFYFTLTLC